MIYPLSATTLYGRGRLCIDRDELRRADTWLLEHARDAPPEAVVAAETRLALLNDLDAVERALAQQSDDSWVDDLAAALAARTMTREQIAREIRSHLGPAPADVAADDPGYPDLAPGELAAIEAEDRRKAAATQPGPAAKDRA